MRSSFNHNEQTGVAPTGLSSQEAFTYIQEGAAILDIRLEYETNYRNFDVPQVYSLPLRIYKEEFHKIPREKSLIVADSVGIRSSGVARFLLNQGYDNVAYLIGGMYAWERNGLPIIKNLDYELNGGCACRLKPKKTYR